MFSVQLVKCVSILLIALLYGSKLATPSFSFCSLCAINTALKNIFLNNSDLAIQYSSVQLPEINALIFELFTSSYFISRP